MTEYKVAWLVNVSAENPREAAVEAAIIQQYQSGDGQPGAFSVTGPSGERYYVDLGDTGWMVEGNA